MEKEIYTNPHVTEDSHSLQRLTEGMNESGDIVDIYSSTKMWKQKQTSEQQENQSKQQSKKCP